MNYWERFEYLCSSIGKKPNPVGKEIGVSSATITKWKNGAIPNGEILLSVADYFGVSTDYLLGRSDKAENSVAINNQAQTFQGTQINAVHPAPEQKAPDTMEEEFIAVFKHLNIMDKVAVMQFAFEKMQKSA